MADDADELAREIAEWWNNEPSGLCQMQGTHFPQLVSLLRLHRDREQGQRGYNCPRCGKAISRKQIASALGKIKSDRKSASSAENGKLGGRPRKQ